MPHFPVLLFCEPGNKSDDSNGNKPNQDSLSDTLDLALGEWDSKKCRHAALQTTLIHGQDRKARETSTKIQEYAQRT
jgi:hypothetical protein